MFNNAVIKQRVACYDVFIATVVVEATRGSKSTALIRLCDNRRVVINYYKLSI